jgi:hypothetical protein
MILKFSFVAFFSIIILNFLAAQDSSLIQKLQKIEGVEINKLEDRAGFKEKYEINILQPLDPKKPDGKKFRQRVYLSHLDYSQPVVFVTEGYFAKYAARPEYKNELSEILNANQIVVEHRYFGNSCPDSMDWKYLTVENAAADHHRICQIFKEIYNGKWISTGISKGGQTSIYYRWLYPNDVDATVAYVAPINFAVEDPRENEFLAKVGTKECRRKIFNFQKILFENKKEILNLFEKKTTENSLHFSIGTESALDFMILEFPFSFWQWGNMQCSEIPQKGSSPDTMLTLLNNVVSIDEYSDENLAKYVPFYYQAAIELGYYGYDEIPFAQWLKEKDYNNMVFAPKNTPLDYQPNRMKEVDTWIQNKGNNIIYIYGSDDPWSASAARVTHKTNALKIIKSGGNHTTRINNLPPEQSQLVIKTLQKWLAKGAE